jgi:BolA protein
MKLEAIIYSILLEKLSADRVEVQDESLKHAGHAGAAPGGETHFDVFVVSERFDGLSRVQRHQLVYDALAEYMNNPIHALAIKAKTPAQMADA